MSRLTSLGSPAYATSFVGLGSTLLHGGLSMGLLALPTLKSLKDDAGRLKGSNGRLKRLVKISGIVSTIALAFMPPPSGEDVSRLPFDMPTPPATRTTSHVRPTQSQDPPRVSESYIPALCVSLSVTGAAVAVLAKSRNGGSAAGSSSSSHGPYAYHMHHGGSGGGHRGGGTPSGGGHSGQPSGGGGPPPQPRQPPAGGGGQRSTPPTSSRYDIRRSSRGLIPPQKPQPLGPPPPPPPPPSHTAPPGEDDGPRRPEVEHDPLAMAAVAFVFGLLVHYYGPWSSKDRRNPTHLNKPESSEMMKEMIQSAVPVDIKNDFDILSLLRDDQSSEDIIVLPPVPLELSGDAPASVSPLENTAALRSPLPPKPFTFVLPHTPPDPGTLEYNDTQGDTIVCLICNLGFAALFAFREFNDSRQRAQEPILEEVPAEEEPTPNLRSAIRRAGDLPLRLVSFDPLRKSATFYGHVCPNLLHDTAIFSTEPVETEYSEPKRALGLYRESVFRKTTVDDLYYYPRFDVTKDPFPPSRKVQYEEYSEVRYFEQDDSWEAKEIIVDAQVPFTPPSPGGPVFASPRSPTMPLGYSQEMDNSPLAHVSSSRPPDGRLTHRENSPARPFSVLLKKIPWHSTPKKSSQSGS